VKNGREKIRHRYFDDNYSSIFGTMYFCSNFIFGNTLIGGNMKNVTLFCTDMNPSGLSDIVIVDEYNQIVDVISEALFGATSKFGDTQGVYYETCGGYNCGIHTAAYSLYGESIIYASNLEPHDCDCDECQTKGYEKSTCAQKDFDSIEYFDSISEFGDIEKLFWLELDAIFRLSAKSPIGDTLRDTIEVLSKYFTADEIAEASDLSLEEVKVRYPFGAKLVVLKK